MRKYGPITKTRLSSDWGLQPDPTKLDSLVIAHQPWRGEYVPGPCNKVAVPEGAAGTPPFWRQDGNSFLYKSTETMIASFIQKRFLVPTFAVYIWKRVYVGAGHVLIYRQTVL